MTQIQECGRSIGGGTVVFDIEWEGELAGASVAWVVSIASSDGSELVRLVHERPVDDSSTQPQQYVEAGPRRHDVIVDADVSDGHVTARFPQDVVGVAVDWPVWKASLDLDGSTVAEAVIPTT